MYRAVLQYNHVGDNERELTFRVKVCLILLSSSFSFIQVVYDSNPDVYAATETLDTPYERVVIDCNDEEIEIYVLGSEELAQFKVQLPNLRSSHFIESRI